MISFILLSNYLAPQLNLNGCWTEVGLRHDKNTLSGWCVRHNRVVRVVYSVRNETDTFTRQGNDGQGYMFFFF